MKTQIIDSLRSIHQTKTGSLSQSDKNQLTRAFNSLAERAGGLGSILTRYNYLEVYRDLDDNRIVIADSNTIAPTNGKYLYEFTVGQLAEGKTLNRSDMQNAISAVAPGWAVVDGTRQARLYVRGRRSTPSHERPRIMDIRSAVLDTMGIIERSMDNGGNYRYSLLSVWNYVARLEAFNRRRSVAYRQAAQALPKASMEVPVIRHSPRPMDSFLETLASKQTPATPADLYALPMPTSITRATRTWGIELEHVDMAGINKPHSSWSAKGDGSLRGARGVNGDTCQACRPDRRARSVSAPTELIFEDGQEYPNGCTCSECIANFVNQFSNLAAITQDDAGIWRFRAVTTTEPITEPALPATWECFCEGQTREFVSPILREINDANLKTLADQLVTRKTNQSAGVHVHVGADGLNLKGHAELVRNWALIEHIITPLYQRENREYCKPLSIANAIAAHNVSSPRSKAEGSYRDHLVRDRYVSVNLCALDAHGTIEFRSMGPVYDYEYLVRWAMFVREMVNVAAAGTPAKLWQRARTFEDVVSILRKYGSEMSR